MKIVNKKEFYKLPIGTVYADFEPNIFTSLKIKLENCFDNKGIPFDYFYRDLLVNVKANSSNEFHDILDSAIADKTSFALDFELIERDGCYDENELFAIYESEDLKGFISQLSNSLSGSVVA
jgi:hypothetical protein